MDVLEREMKICFLDEATQHLDDCESCFLNLGKDKENPEVIEKIFRLVHNLKGTARAVGFANIAEFTHELESLLIKIKKKEFNINDKTVSLLLECNDHLRLIIGILRKDLDSKIDNADILEKIKGHVTANPESNEEAPKASPRQRHDKRK